MYLNITTTTGDLALGMDHDNCSEMEISGIFSDSLLSNHLQIPEMLLSNSFLSPVYNEAVLPQRKDNIALGFYC